MVELEGSEKQIAWADDIRDNMLTMLEEKIALVETDKKATKSEVIRSRECFPEAKTVAETRIAYANALREVKAALLLKKDSRWFIVYRRNDPAFFVNNYCSDFKATVFPEVC